MSSMSATDRSMMPTNSWNRVLCISCWQDWKNSRTLVLCVLSTRMGLLSMSSAMVRGVGLEIRFAIYCVLSCCKGTAFLGIMQVYCVSFACKSFGRGPYLKI